MDPERKITSSALPRRVLRKRGPRALALGLVLLTLTSQAKAQEPITLVGAATLVGQAFEKAKAAYDAYKFFNTLVDPEPTTAELIDRAVLALSNLIIASLSEQWVTEGQTVIDQFRIAAAAPTAANWRTFDTHARAFLKLLQNEIPVDNRYANALGGMYVAVLPLYLQAHLAGGQWGIPPIAGSLAEDVINAARDGLQLSYDMVGARKVTAAGRVQDTTVYSPLYAYVKMHSQSNCFDSAGICAAYFQTNATVQAVRTAASGLLGILQDAGANRPANLKDKHLGGTTVTVDPESWANNWRGYANGAWTPMQEVTDGVFTSDRRCPSGWGIVGVRQVPPPYALMGFLCQKWSLLPPWSPKAPSEVMSLVEYSCGGRLCSYNTTCPDPDFVAGGSMGMAQCVERLDYQTVLPNRGACGRKDVNFNPPNVMPPRGRSRHFQKGVT
jgi:hypothetical protein